MAVTCDFNIPVQGGGFGNYRVAMITLSGTYVTNGFAFPLNCTPEFLAVDSGDNGYVASLSSGVMKLKAMTYTGGDTPAVGYAELANNTSVAGVKILVVFRGDY